MNPTLFESSAGGLVIKDLKKNQKIQQHSKILMVEVKNLEGKVVWTFPKGHLEKKESDQQAALREVEEETGWLCRIIKHRNKNYFEKVHYQFERKGHPVKKNVVWFLMAPLRKIGSKDTEEIRNVRWFSIKTAMEKVEYPSDIKLLNKLSKNYSLLV